MKKLKISLLALCFALIWSCESNQHADVNPDLIESRSFMNDEPAEGFFDGDDNLTTFISISVAYSRGVDKDLFRSIYAADVGMISYTTCTNNETVEIWLIPAMPERQFYMLINSLPDTLYHITIPGTRDGQGSEPLARSSDSFVNVYGGTIFFSYFNECP